MDGASREMTLEEVVNSLSPNHRAKKEYLSLRANGRDACYALEDCLEELYPLSTEAAQLGGTGTGICREETPGIDRAVRGAESARRGLSVAIGLDAPEPSKSSRWASVRNFLCAVFFLK